MADGMIAGTYWMWVATRDSDGYPIGQNRTPDTKVNNTVYAPYRVKHPVSFTPASPTRVTAERQGGQSVRGSRDLGISSLGTAQVVLDSYDEALHALATNTGVDTTTVDDWTMTSQNSGQQDPPQLIIGLTMGFTNGDGNKEFLTGIWHNAQLRPVMPQSSQDGGTNPNPLTYEIVPDFSARLGVGVLFADTDLDVVEQTDTYTLIRHRDPIFVTTYVADGTATSFTLPYKPRSSDASGNTTNLITKAGTPTAVTSVATSTGLVTLAAAGTAADLWVWAGPTRFAPTS